MFIHVDNKLSTLKDKAVRLGRFLLAGIRLVADQQPSHGQIPEQRNGQQRTATGPDPIHDNVLPVRVPRAAPLERRRQHRIEVAARIVER